MASRPVVTRGPTHRPVWLVVGVSLLAGLVAAIVLVLGLASGAQEHVITGSVLVAFGLRWALLALLSVRHTDQPQRWAVVPAAYMLLVGVGLLILAPNANVMDIIGWIWPLALLALVVWVVIQARRDLRSGAR